MKRITLFLAFLVMSIGWTVAQNQVEVSGTVVFSEDGTPVIGATVRGKSSQAVTRTNLEGQFKMMVPASEKFLVVSYVGMKTREVPVGKNLRIALEDEATILDDIVIVAFGKAKKSAYTGSATQLNAKELEKRQVSNVTQALAGMTPGVTVTSGNNQPGTSASVRIRGIGSFNASSSPLYVVDGVPFDGDIASINTADIASTSVLKDAASAALYGARGANGVIMIQTKSGSGVQDKMNVTFEARYGVNQRGVADYDVIKDPKVYAAKFFEGIYNSEMLKEGATHDAAFAAAKGIYFSTDPKVANLGYQIFTFPTTGEPFTKQADGSFVMNPEATVGAMYTGTDGKKYWLTPDNWADEVFSTNPRQEYIMTVSGRSSNANYFASAGYLSDRGYTVGSHFDRFTSRLRSEFTPLEWIKLGGNIGFTHYTSRMLDETNVAGSSANIFAITNFIAPIYPIYVRGEDKNILKDQWNNTVYDYGDGTYPGLTRPYLSISNPISKNTLDYSAYVADIISARGFVDFNLAKGLTATMNVGYDVDNTYGTEVSNSYYGQYAGSGYVSKSFTRNSSINLQQLLTYTTAIGKNHFDFLLGHEFYKRVYESFSGSKAGMYDPNNREINGAILKPSVYSSTSRYATEGFLGRVQYDYNNKYFLQASFRRDASSNFAKNNRWGNFWSVGGSWLISSEDWMKGAGFDMLKLKASYGMQGNDAIGSFTYMDLFSLKNANDQVAISFSSKGNPNLTWETSGNLNAGIEFAILKERLSGSIDVYSREVSDMLFWRPVARSAGYSGYYDNIGSMRNVGIDFELKAVLAKSKDFYWDLSVNGGMFKNTLTKLPQEWEEVKGGYRDGSAVYRVGGSIYDRAYPHYLGVDDQGRSLWFAWQDKKDDKGQVIKGVDGEPEQEAGTTTDPTVAQLSKNRTIFTDIAPVLNGGINTSVEFHGVDFSIGTSYALGGRIYDNTYVNLMHGGQGSEAGNNWHVDILKSWTPEKKNADADGKHQASPSDVPMVNYSGKNFASLSDRFLISRNYLAINNITLGYTLPKSLLGKSGISALRVYVVGDNLAVFSARKGFDPRFGTGVGYKAMRSFSAGVRITL